MAPLCVVRLISPPDIRADISGRKRAQADARFRPETAGSAPVGQVPNAVMRHVKLQRGQRLPQILVCTKSLGIKLADNPETFEWRDAGGDAVRIELRGGRLERWTLQRAADTMAESPNVV